MRERKKEITNLKQKRRGAENKAWIVGLLTIFLSFSILLTGCSSNSKLSGVYVGTGGGKFTFKDDGTCAYEEEYMSKVASYNGTWTFSKKDNTCEIVLNGIGGTLYGSVSDTGDITITSDSSFWSTEIYSKEQSE